MATPTKDAVDASCSPLEALRLRFLEYCAQLLEGQVRSHQYSTRTRDLVQSEHEGILADLLWLGESDPDSPFAQGILATARRCESLETALDLLSQERIRAWDKNSEFVREIMREFEQTTAELSHSLIDKALLERQSRVLESIIFSYERISQWKVFVQEILADFHKVFPFDFFIVAFAEEHCLRLYLYFMGRYDETARAAVRARFVRSFLEQLALPPETAVDVEEFAVLQEPRQISMDHIGLLTVGMPEHLPQIAGLLGVGYASTTPLTTQERGIIHSILSVMMMVVGSSKVLSRTLEELEYYSSHDPLTGLHNRRHFNEMLDYEVGRSERHVHEFSILFLDIDDFKEVNDSYGHPMGDEVLRGIAEIVRVELRKGDLACRMGGDEIAILLPETPAGGGMRVADNLRERIHSHPFHVPSTGKPFYTSVSVGVVSYPGDASTIDELMACVDVSLYQAKRQGKNAVVGAENAHATLQETRATRAHVEDLRLALREDRLVPYYQPIINCQSGEVFAFECLARLQAESGEVISAAAFVEQMERYGLAHEMDRKVIEKALQEKHRALPHLGPNTRIFINLSAQEMQGRGIIAHAEALCERFGIPPDRIVFEILEREAIGDMSNMRTFLARLREKGFAFALDDFGSGYNSFHYLRELHFEYVKLDGAFVRNILTSRVDRILVTNLISLCHDLEIETVAEFVESAEVLGLLRDIGASYAQGYYIGMPQPRMGPA